jgi:hypothetical protein
LRQNFLRAERKLFCLDNAKNLTVNAKGIVRGAAVGRVFLDGAILVGTKGAVRLERR